VVAPPLIHGGEPAGVWPDGVAIHQILLCGDREGEGEPVVLTGRKRRWESGCLVPAANGTNGGNLSLTTTRLERGEEEIGAGASKAERWVVRMEKEVGPASCMGQNGLGI
jgi:hypothetical protein